MKMTEYEARQRVAEMIAGKQDAAVDAMNQTQADLEDKPFENMTVLELVEYVIVNADELNPFWQ